MNASPVRQRNIKKPRQQVANVSVAISRAMYAIPHLIWCASPDGSVKYCNQAWLDYTGMTAKNVRGQGWASAIHSEDRESLLAMWRRAIREGVTGLAEARMRRADGTFGWFLISVMPQREAHGRIVRWYGTSTGIEAPKSAMQSLREPEQSFGLIADTAPILIWISDKTKLCTYFNKAWLDFTGRRLEEELGNGWAEGVHPEDLKSCVETYSRAFDLRQTFKMEYRLRRHDGVYRWVLDIGVPWFDRDGSFDGYVGTGFDITERKQIEDELQKGEERFRLAAQIGRMIAYEWDAATDGVTLSGEFSEISGIEGGANTTGEVMLAMVHPDDREKLAGEVANLSPEKPHLHLEFRVTRSDGSVIWMEQNSHGLFDEQGKLLRTVGMVTDITERKRSEEIVGNVSRQLIEAQEQERMRIARELHDNTNQRLALLAVEIEQIKNDFPLEMAELQARLEKIRRNAEDISRDVQALSHELHSSKLSYLGLISAMRSSCKDFSETQKVDVVFESRDLPSPVPPEVSLSLFRILQEALHNAAKHGKARKVEVKLWGTPDEICLLVADFGAGFDLEAARKGPGLGLVSMQERVRMMNGTLTIETHPGLGTAIRIHVPVNRKVSSMGAAG
jgi:PAS domain S-box-containing protein